MTNKGDDTKDANEAQIRLTIHSHKGEMELQPTDKTEAIQKNLVPQNVRILPQNINVDLHYDISNKQETDELNKLNRLLSMYHILPNGVLKPDTSPSVPSIKRSRIHHRTSTRTRQVLRRSTEDHEMYPLNT